MPAALSSYDAAVPHPGRDPALADRFGALRALRPPVDLDTVGRVVLLVSSSRGGSSMVTELLRRTPGVLSLPGEVNPHVVTAQLSGGDADVFRAELARDVGRPAETVELDRLVHDTCWRLVAQWPRLDIDPDEVRAAVCRAAQTRDPCTGAAEFTANVLGALASTHPLAEAAYDLPDATGTPPPPTEPVIEMTPYVGFRPWRAPTAAELTTMPLVIATPRNSYRLDWLVALFPQSDVRVVHLTRNPAAAVNGLIDGWNHPAFFTTRVDVDLDIDGYEGDASRGWWKYDVPPRWRDLVDADLAVVCAEQWRSAHAAVIEFAERRDILVHRVRYEDFVGPPAARTAAADALAAFLGVDATSLRTAVLDGVPPVMATAPPQRRRWSSSGNDLAPALAEPHVWEVATALGYDVEERLWI